MKRKIDNFRSVQRTNGSFALMLLMTLFCLATSQISFGQASTAAGLPANAGTGNASMTSFSGDLTDQEKLQRMQECYPYFQVWLSSSQLLEVNHQIDALTQSLTLQGLPMLPHTDFETYLQTHSTDEMVDKFLKQQALYMEPELFGVAINETNFVNIKNEMNMWREKITSNL